MSRKRKLTTHNISIYWSIQHLHYLSHSLYCTTLPIKAILGMVLPTFCSHSFRPADLDFRLQTNPSTSNAHRTVNSLFCCQHKLNAIGVDYELINSLIPCQRALKDLTNSWSIGRPAYISGSSAVCDDGYRSCCPYIYFCPNRTDLRCRTATDQVKADNVTLDLTFFSSLGVADHCQFLD